MSSKKAFKAMGRNQLPRKDVCKGDRLTETALGFMVHRIWVKKEFC